MSNTVQTKLPVLVVGAGPVGLTMASELLRRGVPCRLIEQKSSPATSSRALGTHARTLEMYQNMGVIDAFKSRAQKVNHFAIYESGLHLSTMNLDFSRFDTPFEASFFIAQTETEHILRDHLERFGGQIEWSTTLEALEQNTDGITATVTLADGTTEHIAADWIVGCDGGHSKTRKLLGLPFEGMSDETWFVADVEIDWSVARDSIYMVRNDGGSLTTYPFPEAGRWRLLDTAPSDMTDGTQLAAKFSEMLSSGLGQRITVQPPTWSSVFTIQQRMVPTMRQGRGFVAGDAAHVHSPASGRGLNFGIQDAINLTWKLALVIHGQAPETLLDSYSAERHPVAAELLKGSVTATRLLKPRNLIIKRLRGRVVQTMLNFPLVKRRASATTSATLSMLKLAYPISPIVCDDWPQNKSTDVRPGDRVPEVIFDGSSLFASIQGTQHTLLLFVSNPHETATIAQFASLQKSLHSQYAIPLAIKLVSNGLLPETEVRWADTVINDPLGVLHRRFGALAGGAYLIRPDWYVAYRTSIEDLAGIERYFSRTFSSLPQMAWTSYITWLVIGATISRSKIVKQHRQFHITYGSGGIKVALCYLEISQSERDTGVCKAMVEGYFCLNCQTRNALTQTPQRECVRTEDYSMWRLKL